MKIKDLPEPKFKLEYGSPGHTILELSNWIRLCSELSDEEYSHVDENREFIFDHFKRLIEEIGWPTIPNFGEDVSQHAAYIACHCENTEWQKEWIILMTKCRISEINLSDLAFVTDCQRLNRGQEQLFGTQFSRQRGEEYKLAAIECVQHVNDRRERMGLEKLKPELLADISSWPYPVER